METRVLITGEAEDSKDKMILEATAIIKEQHPAENGIIDIHTHHAAPQPGAVISLRVGGEITLPTIEAGQAYSVGIHPWDTINEIPDAEWARLENLAQLPEVVAIGEAGVDLNLQGVPMYRQLQVLKRQIELSEALAKPLVLHDVKAHDIIIGLRRDLAPRQNWAIHGFRGKPEVAQMLLRKGCYMSFGENFNAETLREMPRELILAETDESELTIQEVIAKMSETVGADLTAAIEANTARFLTPNN